VSAGNLFDEDERDDRLLAMTEESAYVPCAIGAPRDLLALIDERAQALGETRTGYLLGLARADLAQAGVDVPAPPPAGRTAAASAARALRRRSTPAAK